MWRTVRGVEDGEGCGGRCRAWRTVRGVEEGEGRGGR